MWSKADFIKNYDNFKILKLRWVSKIISSLALFVDVFVFSNHYGAYLVNDFLPITEPRSFAILTNFIYETYIIKFTFQILYLANTFVSTLVISILMMFVWNEILVTIYRFWLPTWWGFSNIMDFRYLVIIISHHWWSIWDDGEKDLLLVTFWYLVFFLWIKSFTKIFKLYISSPTTVITWLSPTKTRTRLSDTKIGRYNLQYMFCIWSWSKDEAPRLDNP